MFISCSSGRIALWFFWTRIHFMVTVQCTTYIC